MAQMMEYASTVDARHAHSAAAACIWCQHSQGCYMRFPGSSFISASSMNLPTPFPPQLPPLRPCLPDCLKKFTKQSKRVLGKPMSAQRAISICSAGLPQQELLAEHCCQQFQCWTLCDTALWIYQARAVGSKPQGQISAGNSPNWT